MMNFVTILVTAIFGVALYQLLWLDINASVQRMIKNMDKEARKIFEEENTKNS